jgi:hypothetical protein
MCLPARLQRKAMRAINGLLIELSQDGARVSNLGKSRLQNGDSVSLSVGEARTLAGKVHWAHDGLAGIKLDPPLRIGEMEALLDYNYACQQQVMPRYGT